MTRCADLSVGPVRRDLLRAFVLLVALFSFAAHAVDVTRLLDAFRRLGGPSGVFRDWRALVDQSRPLAAAEKLQLVNDFVNRSIRPGEDEEVWGQEDYWATPMESLAKGKGDCEDYAIAKYFTLLDAGIPDAQLRLVYVNALVKRPSGFLIQSHMVLAYYRRPDAEPLVLDNLVPDIRPAGLRPDLAPVLSFNIQGAWPGADGTARGIPGGNGHLSRWQDLLLRAKAEGFE